MVYATDVLETLQDYSGDAPNGNIWGNALTLLFHEALKL